MRLVQIDNGKVVNFAIGAEGQDIPDGWMLHDTAQIGWDIVDSIPVEPPKKPVEAYIPDLTFAQLLIGLVTVGWITEAEGEAWLIGTVPEAVNAVLSQLPAEQRFAAKARAVRPSIVKRDDPMVEALGQLQGKTKEELDQFFLTFAKV